MPGDLSVMVESMDELPQNVVGDGKALGSGSTVCGSALEALQGEPQGGVSAGGITEA